ncbi:MAG: toll/interleukin-1 receptor domain-containing protein, partial [Cyanobacteria bacterium P01_A01_bin.70]
MGQPGSIFISYRRSDSITEAGRIYDRLVEAFGAEQIFKDVDNIPYGADFVEYLDQAVSQCDVLLPLIGSTWLSTTDAQGERRLNDPNDFVRIEIESALKRDILVVPILLNGAVMPGPSDLKGDLQVLARRNAAQVRHDPDFHSDMRRLISKLEEYFVSRGLAAAPSPQGVAPLAASTPETKSNNAVLIPAGLSFLGGLMAILLGGAPIDYGIGILLFAAGGILFAKQTWAWGVAVAMQAVVTVICGLEAYS